MIVEQIVYEGTAENMSFIRDITALVLANMSDTIYRDTDRSIYGDDLKSKNAAPYTLEDLKKKYKKHDKVIDYLKDTSFVFLHYPPNLNVKTYGAYDYGENRITLNITAMAKTTDDVSKEQLLKDSKNNSYGIIPVLFHEIRHAVQQIEYTEHFLGKGRSGDYKKRDIEIDAKWHDSLETYDIKYFKNAKAYATAVMNDLKDERDLTPKQEKHYWYKTIKYYLNPEIDKPHANTRERLEQYITTKVPQNILQLLNNRLDRDTRGNITDLDLRRIPAYNYKNFFFPVPRVWGAVTGALSDGNARNNFQKNMIYLLTAAVLTSGEKKIANDIAKYMKKVHNYTPQEAIANLSEGIPPELFDIDHVRQHMKNIFGV